MYKAFYGMPLQIFLQPSEYKNMVTIEQLCEMAFEKLTPHEVQEQFEGHEIVLIDVRT